MARAFNPQFHELVSEAFARAEIRPNQVTQEHLDELIRSAGFVLTDFTNRGVTQFQLVKQTITLEAGTPTYDLMDGAVDAWHVMVIRDGQYSPVFPFSRSDYHSLPDKDNEGRPIQYFTERGVTGTTSRTITLWPVPDRADTLDVWVWCWAEDQTSLAQDAPISREFIDAYADALALRMAKKFNRMAVAGLEQDALISFGRAFSTNRERAPARMRMRGYVRGRGRTR